MKQKLYEYANKLPIIDYHNHLSVTDIKENKRFTDIYELWIAPDPYKHRAMRMCGVEEIYITGNASNKEKFIKWCETIPELIGNPLYAWSYMELEAVFGKVELSEPENLYEECNAYLAEHEVTVNTLLKNFNVEFACPCASITDDLSAFENNPFIVPSLRGDDMIAPTKEFIKKLADASDIKIFNLKSYCDAILKRLDAFKNAGCKLRSPTPKSPITSNIMPVR